MNDTLFLRAIHDYNAAAMIFNAMGDDDVYLNNIGYLLQQALEKTVKYLLNENGVEYPKTHDIDQLIRIAKTHNTELFLTEYIEEHSEMFSLWESRTRYVLNYRLEYDKVERAMTEVDKYLTIVQNKEEEGNITTEYQV